MKRNNLMMYLLITAALLMTALILAGCTGTGTGANAAAAGTTMAEMTTVAAAGETTAAAIAVVKNEISIKGNTFSPDNLSIKVGDTVTWVNNDSYAHTVKGKAGEFDSGNMASGAKFSFTFDKEGTIDYICGIHTFMTGKIVVTK
jgi:plastocyanin